jgi:hypothetical protein
VRVPTLYQFFRHQVQRGFQARGLGEPATVDYVSEVLARFAETRALYPFRDTDGRALEHIVDLLCERERADRAHTRSVSRHLGEYTLFMSGLFRDRLVRRGELPYYLAQGASAYAQCADHEPSAPRRQLYRRLTAGFRDIADSLDAMRHSQFPLRPEPGAAAAQAMLAACWRT